MKVLITGAAGFIGHHLAMAWLRRGAEVVAVDNFRTGYRRNLDVVARTAEPGRFTFVEGSILDASLVAKAAAGCSVVHHLAAQVSVPESVEQPETSVDINVRGLLHVLDAARREGASRVVFSSSAAVYGDDPRSPKTEDMTPAPKSPYGITKLDGEFYLRMYAEMHGLPAVSLRYFNVFGPRQDPKGAYAAAVPIMMDRALKGEDITVFGDGGQTRDFVFVEDVCMANILAATSPNVGRGEVFNVANGGAITILELAQQIVRLTGSASRVAHAPPRAGDIRHSLASIDRIRAALGFAPAVGLDAGLARCVEAARATA